jgi:hypothetical protein
VHRAAHAVGIKFAIRIEVAMEVLVGVRPLPCMGRLMELTRRVSPPLRAFPSKQRVMEAAEKYASLRFLNRHHHPLSQQPHRLVCHMAGDEVSHPSTCSLSGLRATPPLFPFPPLFRFVFFLLPPSSPSSPPPPGWRHWGGDNGAVVVARCIRGHRGPPVIR